MRRIDTRRFLVRPHTRVNLARFDPDDTGPLTSRKRARTQLRKSQARLTGLTDLLFAQNRWSLLLIFQGMDGAGKDGAIKHVMRGLDPKATMVHAFGPPSTGERSHDYMWRCLKALPERGHIGIFNRSYYEEVLVVRVHPELLESEHLPRERVTARIWKERFEDIRHIERYLCRNGTVIRKFFLHLSKSEQRRRFLSRLDDPAKNWKFSRNDIAERRKWPEYMKAYEAAISETSTRYAPWYIIPANQKWFTRLAVAHVIIEAMESMKLHYPPLTHKKRRELAAARRRLRGGRRKPG
ncbi:MAG TPA: polyphosphate kinase 2 family protein [Vicinamibacterales bacterium]|nr:polyphosphate kinase 2 family protein [Vicinamibacterales bacterium]